MLSELVVALALSGPGNLCPPLCHLNHLVYLTSSAPADWLIAGSAEKVVIVIADAASGESMERWEFDIVCEQEDQNRFGFISALFPSCSTSPRISARLSLRPSSQLNPILRSTYVLLRFTLLTASLSSLRKRSGPRSRPSSARSLRASHSSRSSSDSVSSLSPRTAVDITCLCVSFRAVSLCCFLVCVCVCVAHPSLLGWWFG